MDTPFNSTLILYNPSFVSTIASSENKVMAVNSEMLLPLSVNESTIVISLPTYNTSPGIAVHSDEVLITTDLPSSPIDKTCPGHLFPGLT